MIGQRWATRPAWFISATLLAALCVVALLLGLPPFIQIAYGSRAIAVNGWTFQALAANYYHQCS
jgi:hypothetical protein